MVSRMRYFSFKGGGPRSDRMPFLGIIVVLAVVVAIAIDPPAVLLAIGVLYALSGPALLRCGAGRAGCRRSRAGMSCVRGAQQQREWLQALGARSADAWCRLDGAAGCVASPGGAPRCRLQSRAPARAGHAGSAPAQPRAAAHRCCAPLARAAGRPRAR